MAAKPFVYSAIVHSLILAAAYVAIVRPHSEDIPVEMQESRIPLQNATKSTVTSKSVANSVAETRAEKPESSGKSGDSASNNAYIQAMRQRIFENQEYPKLAARDHLEDLITMQIEIGESGELIKIMSITAKKPEILIHAARLAIERSAPFPPPPAGFPRKFDVPIEFRLSK